MRVRDNYIHHNQQVGRLGYGVAVKDRAYALEVTLGFFNADNICDVWVDGVIYPGGGLRHYHHTPSYQEGVWWRVRL